MGVDMVDMVNPQSPQKHPGCETDERHTHATICAWTYNTTSTGNSAPPSAPPGRSPSTGYTEWRIRTAIWPASMALAWSLILAAACTGSNTVGFHTGIYLVANGAAVAGFVALLFWPEKKPLRIFTVAAPAVAAAARLGDWLIEWANGGPPRWFAMSVWLLVLWFMVYANPNMMPPPFRNGEAKAMLDREGLERG